MAACNDLLLPQQGEKPLIIQGYKYIKSRIPIGRVGHDGKRVKDIQEIDSGVAEDLDPWHFKKLELKRSRFKGGDRDQDDTTKTFACFALQPRVPHSSLCFTVLATINTASATMTKVWLQWGKLLVHSRISHPSSSRLLDVLLDWNENRERKTLYTVGNTMRSSPSSPTDTVGFVFTTSSPKIHNLNCPAIFPPPQLL